MIYQKDDTIPRPLYDALVDSDSEYGKEVKEYLNGKKYDFAISVTSLLKSPRQYQLLRRHHDKIVINPVDDLWHSLLGTIVHYILERYGRNIKGEMAEVRMGVDFVINGKTVHLHGKFDNYVEETKHLRDYKLTSALSMLYDKEEHELQLNILRLICEYNGINVDKISNIYLFPHLDKRMKNNENYPKRYIEEKFYNVRSEKEVIQLIKRRIKAHVEAIECNDEELPFCTDEERWIRDTVYKVFTMKKDGKGFSSRAAYVSTSLNELREYIKNNINGSYMESSFKGKPTRCLYCKASNFCNQLQKELIDNPKLLEA
jgi:hypothetical protein